MGWKNWGYTKKGFIIGLIVGLILLFGSGITASIYGYMNIGEYKCPVLVDKVTCTPELIPFLVIETLILVGLPLFILSLIFGSWIGYGIKRLKLNKDPSILLLLLIPIGLIVIYTVRNLL